MQGNHSFRSCRSTADTESAEADPSSHSNSMHGDKPSEGLHFESACVPVDLLPSLNKQAVVSSSSSTDGMCVQLHHQCKQLAKGILLSDVPLHIYNSCTHTSHAFYTDGVAMSCRLACKRTSTRAASRSNSLVWNDDLGARCIC